MHLAKATMEGSSFLGIFAKTNDHVTFLPRNAHEKLKRVCSEVLKTRIVTATIANSNLLGIMSAMNSSGIVLPRTVYDSEVKFLEGEGFKTGVITDRRTALGNNVLANDSACLVNPAMSPRGVQEIKDCLDVEVIRGTIGGGKTVGGMAVVTNCGILTRTNVSDEELSFLEDVFKVKGTGGTANMGVPFVGLCMIANSNGFVAGEMTSGFELGRIDEALGLIGR